jgi:GNAT superfamily N-acetyltransferase
VKQLTMRPAVLADAGQIADLCTQLGYPTSEAQFLRRLARILGDHHHAVYVAEQLRTQVVGWVHVYVPRLLVLERRAEIGGLVVDEGHHHSGIGRRLMEKAEEWARANDCEVVHLRSNVAREGAHRFYERLGFRQASTQQTFQKTL